MDDSMDNGAADADRRTFLKRAAAAGVLAWSTPIVLAQSSAANDAVCTPAGLPSVVQGDPVPSFTCSGAGNNRRISYRIEFPAPQVTCPVGGTPAVTPISCTTNLGMCVPNQDGSATWTYDSPGRGGDATVDLARVVSVTCGTGCAVTCTTNVTVVFDVQDNGNCNITTRVASNTTTCVPA